MGTKRTAFLAFIVLIAVAFATVARSHPPAPLPADAPEAEFSAARALEHIRVLAVQH